MGPVTIALSCLNKKRLYAQEVAEMTQAQAIKEMEVVGLKHKATHDFLPWQHFMIFERPAKP